MYALLNNHTEKTHSNYYLANECVNLRIIGVFLIALFVSSLFFNSTLAWAFFVRREALKFGLNIIIATLAINNLICIVFQLPISILNSLMCRYFKAE